MRVDDKYLAQSQAAQTGRTNAAQETQQIERSAEKNRAGKAWTPGTDRVEISTLASGVAHVLEQASQERATKLQKLTADYAAGRYQVDSLEVSRAILAEIRTVGAGPEKP